MPPEALRSHPNLGDTFALARAGSGRVNNPVPDTGIVIDPRGYVITNFHVVEDVSTIRVGLSDGSTHAARVLAWWPCPNSAVSFMSIFKSFIGSKEIHRGGRDYSAEVTIRFRPDQRTIKEFAAKAGYRGNCP